MRVAGATAQRNEAPYEPFAIGIVYVSPDGSTSTNPRAFNFSSKAVAGSVSS